MVLDGREVKCSSYTEGSSLTSGSNPAPKPPSVSEMWAAIDKFKKSTKGMPAKAYARQSFIDNLQRASQSTMPLMAKFSGIPIHCTENLPKGVLCMLFDEEGKPITMMHDDTYEPINLETATA